MGPHRNPNSRTCHGCRYWSELVAQYGGGVNGAMCLSPTSPLRGKYTGARQTCADWRIGHLGAVDEPGTDGNEYQRAAEIPRPVRESSRCADCARCLPATDQGRTLGRLCTESWPGLFDDEGDVTGCSMFVLERSGRDTGAAS